MGNVSQVVPSIHPLLTIRGHQAPPHNPGFTAAAATPEADDAIIDGSVSMARDRAGRRAHARTAGRLHGAQGRTARGRHPGEVQRLTRQGHTLPTSKGPA